MGENHEINVCHLISGDLWAGAEVQTCTLLRSLNDTPGLTLSAILLNEGRLANELRKLGIRTVVIEEGKHSFFEIKRMLEGSLSSNCPDILHTHRYKENVLGALAGSKLRHTCLIQTVHGVQEGLGGLKKLKMNMYMHLNDYMTRKHYSKIVAVSRDIEVYLRKKHRSDRVVAIHNAVDLSNLKLVKPKEEIRKEFGIGETQTVIGAVGRLVPVKGFDIFLRTAGVILESFHDTVFLIAGDGPLRKELSGLVSSLGIDKHVIFTGFRDDIHDIMNMFDIFVVSSHHEGIPMSVLEVMALKKAVVSTAVGGITEIIDNNKSGLLVEPGNPNALAEACISMLRDRELMARIESMALERIKEEYSSDIQRDRVLKLYREVVAYR